MLAPVRPDRLRRPETARAPLPGTDGRLVSAAVVIDRRAPTPALQEEVMIPGRAENLTAAQFRK